MVRLSLCIAALAATTNAFTTLPQTTSRPSFTASYAGAFAAPEVDATGNNLAIKNLLTGMEDTGFLTKVASSGILSKAQKAGVTLSSLEPFLELASSNPDLLVLVEAAGPDILPLLPKLVELAPDALPLLALGLEIKPGTLSTLGAAALAGAVGAVVLIPDDTLLEVAAQTLLASTLAGAGVAAYIGSQALSNPVAAAKKAIAFL